MLICDRFIEGDCTSPCCHSKPHSPEQICSDMSFCTDIDDGKKESPAVCIPYLCTDDEFKEILINNVVCKAVLQKRCDGKSDCPHIKPHKKDKYCIVGQCTKDYLTVNDAECVPWISPEGRHRPDCPVAPIKVWHILDAEF